MQGYCGPQETDAQEVNIMSTEGKFIAHSRPEMTGKQCSEKECQSVLASEKICIQYRTTGEQTLLYISSPMIVMNKKIGYVTVVMTNASIQGKITEVERDILQISIIAVLIGLMFTFIIVHFLVVPIRKLREGALIVGTGNFEHRIIIKNKNEIGELAITFNKMAESLQRSKEQLASLNATSRAINTTIERDLVINKTLDAVESIIRPRQFLICLISDYSIQIVALSGFDPGIISPGNLIQLPEQLTQDATENGFVISTTFNKIQLLGSHNSIELCNTKSNERLIIPLRYENSIRGFFIVNGKKDGTKFTNTDKEYIEIISSSTTIALLNIELLNETAEKARMQTELEMAETVQRTLFPEKPVITKDIEVFGYFKSASETGGDWYYTLHDQFSKSLYVFIGDVTGHGVPAALNTATAYSFVHTLNLVRHNLINMLIKYQQQAVVDSRILKSVAGLISPVNVLNLLNSVLLKKSQKAFLMTFFSTLIDLQKKKVYFANAGHEMPLIIRGDTKEIEPLVSSGVRLGDQSNVSFEQKYIDIHTGDTIIWYTDGIIEGVNEQGEEYGTRRFYRTIKKAAGMNSTEEILNFCIDDFNSFINNQSLLDDVTLVVARIIS